MRNGIINIGRLFTSTVVQCHIAACILIDAKNNLTLVIFTVLLNYRYSFTVNFYSFSKDGGIRQWITIFIIAFISYIIDGKAAAFIFRLFAQSHMPIQ